MTGIITNIITFASLGNLQIVLLKGICSNYGPFKGTKGCDRANCFISLEMITYGVLMLSYGHRLIVNDKDKYSKFPYNENLLEKDGKLESFDS